MKPPSIKECFEYCNNMEQAVAFHSYFESVGWVVGKKGNAKPMQKWKGALTGWINRHKAKPVSKVDVALANKGHRLTDRLWKRFTEIYGSKWTSNYGAEPSVPWIEVIERLPPESIKYGLSRMLKKGDSWPPALTEFHKMCTGNKSRAPYIKSIPYKNIKQLRFDTKEIRINEMEKIRSML